MTMSKRVNGINLLFVSLLEYFIKLGTNWLIKCLREKYNRKTKIKYRPVGILNNIIEYHTIKIVERIKIVFPNTQISSNISYRVQLTGKGEYFIYNYIHRSVTWMGRSTNIILPNLYGKSWQMENGITKIKYRPVGILNNIIEYHTIKIVERIKIVFPNTQISSRFPCLGQALQ
jgi:hypothetical protein